MDLVAWASETSRAQLEQTFPRRWAHVQSVASEARRIASIVGDDEELLVAACLLHDVGYAPDLAQTGLHALDGARFLQRLGAPRRLTCLVARHSCAMLEAEMRGLDADLAGFADELTPTRDALWYCDMVTGPDGRRVRFEDRVAEIRERYGEAALVARFIVRAASGELGAAIERTIKRMEQVDIAQPRYG